MKPKYLAMLAAVLSPLLITIAAAQTNDVDLWFERMVAAESAGYENVDNFVRKSETMGMSTFEYYEKTSAVQLDNGQTVYIMRNVPPNEIQERQSASELANATPGELERAASAVEQAGIQMEQGMMSEMNANGLPGGMGPMLMNPPPDQPWLSPNPRDMTSMYATMLRGAAAAKVEQASQNPADMAEQRAQAMAAMRDKTVVTEGLQWNGIDVVELAANGLDYTQVSNGQSSTIRSMKLLVDAERHVPLYMKMEGDFSDGGETRPITIEREDRDYRKVPGCGDMYEPFNSVMRLGGAMTPEQEKQLAEAAGQLEELESQMASMPPSQREMMEKMMGPQLEMIRNMAAGGGGGIEINTKIVELRCNTGLPDPAEMLSTLPGMPSGGAGVATRPAPGKSTAPADDTELVQVIQESLVELGYQPGNTDGVMDKGTAVAISQFEAVRGLTVTGQPSWEIAGLLGRAIEDGAFYAPK